MATIYWPGAEEDLPSERVEFEFENFKTLVAGYRPKGRFSFKKEYYANVPKNKWRSLMIPTFRLLTPISIQFQMLKLNCVHQRYE